MFVGSLRPNGQLLVAIFGGIDTAQARLPSCGGRAYATDGLDRSTLAGFAAVGAEAAYFCAGDCDFDFAVAGDLALQLLVEFAFELADFAAADAGYMDVIARAVALVEMAVAAEMQEIELVDQAVALQEVESAIDSDAGYARVEFLGALEDFVGVEVAAGGVHNLEQDAALTG